MTAAVPEPASPFTVLVVCTANRFRSPIAEFVLGRAAGDRWRVGSAGVAARPGEPMEPRTAGLLGEHGYDVTDWTTHRLDHALLAGAGLVLVADSSHRRAIGELDVSALRRTFLLLEFARLATKAYQTAGRLPAGSGTAELLGVVARARVSLQPVAPGTDDLADPVGRPDRVLRACAQRIVAAAADIVALVPQPGGASAS